MKNRILLSVVAMFFIASPAWAALSLYSTVDGTPGGDTNWKLSAGVNQIPVYAVGSDSGNYVKLQVVIGGGGVDADMPTGGPKITDIVFNSAFDSWASSGVMSGSDQMWAFMTKDQANNASFNWGTPFQLATVTLDTSGVADSKLWSLEFTESGVSDSQGLNHGAGLTSGTIQVVPEPATMAMLLSLLVAAPVMVWRRRKVA